MEFLWQHEQAAHSPALTWEEPALPDAPSLGPPGSQASVQSRHFYGGAGAIDFLLFLSLFFCLWLGWVSFDVWASLAAASRGASSLQHTGSSWRLSQCCSWWLPWRRPWRLPWQLPWRLLVTAALGGSSGAARGGS